MRDQQILEQAIEKAIKDGWLNNKNLEAKWHDADGYHRGYWFIFDAGSDNYEFQTMEIIFNHDFAKSLWGETTERGFRLIDGKFEEFGNSGWQYHIRQMAIANDPIAYLGSHI